MQGSSQATTGGREGNHEGNGHVGDSHAMSARAAQQRAPRRRTPRSLPETLRNLACSRARQRASANHRDTPWQPYTRAVTSLLPPRS
eukprot:365766-Chlamydomonas_euryale.AAC.2